MSGQQQQQQPEGAKVAKKSPTDFLENILGRRVFVRLNSGVDYKGVLACLDGYMNIALEQTEEYVEGELRNRYGDAFIRGNNVLYISTVADNNVDSAVMLYFDNDGMPLNNQDRDTGPSSGGGGLAHLQGDEVRAPIAARSDVLVDGGGYSAGFDDSIYDPHYNRHYQDGGQRAGPAMSSIFNQQASRAGLEPFRDFAQEAADIAGETSTASGQASRRSRLAELFKPPFDIMHNGTLDSARSEAQEKGKWVIINLQDVSDFKCQALNRDIWRQDIIKAIVKRDFVLFQRSIDTAEGSRLANMYGVNEYPFIAAIHPKTGELRRPFTRVDPMADMMEDLTSFIADNPMMSRRGKKYSGSEASTSRSASRATTTTTTTNTTSTTSRIIAGIHNMSEEDQLAAAIAASELESRPSGQRSSRASGGRVVVIDSDSGSELESEPELEDADSYSDIQTLSSYDDDEDDHDDEDDDYDQVNSDMDVDDAMAARGKMAEQTAASVGTSEEHQLQQTRADDPDAWYGALPSSEPLEPAPGSTVTRIQLRLPNGQRVVRRFSKFDKVSAIFQYIKASQPGASESSDVPEIMFMNKQLSECVGQTIEEAKLTNASLVVDI
ncbi:UBX domain protein Ubx2 [Coemansia sp. RSA 1200]|nr:UBX domain protein Ubx2 [Coemansia sp. RSA 1200]